MFIIKCSNLSFLICGRAGLIFIPPLIKAGLFYFSAKMTLHNGNEALFQVKKPASGFI